MGLNGIVLALAIAKGGTLHAVDGLLVDHKVEPLKDPNYKKKVRFSAKGRVYAVDRYKQTECVVRHVVARGLPIGQNDHADHERRKKHCNCRIAELFFPLSVHSKGYQIHRLLAHLLRTIQVRC